MSILTYFKVAKQPDNEMDGPDGPLEPVPSTSKSPSVVKSKSQINLLKGKATPRPSSSTDNVSSTTSLGGLN